MTAPKEKDRSLLGESAAGIVDGAKFLWGLFDEYSDGPAGDRDPDEDEEEFEDEEDVVDTEGEEVGEA